MLFIVAMAVSICSGAANRSADGKSEDASREAGSARRQRHNEFVADNSQFGSLDGSSSMKRRIYVSEPDVSPYHLVFNSISSPYLIIV